jgi:hypothetical protein
VWETLTTIYISGANSGPALAAELADIARAQGRERRRPPVVPVDASSGREAPEARQSPKDGASEPPSGVVRPSGARRPQWCFPSLHDEAHDHKIIFRPNLY